MSLPIRTLLALAGWLAVSAAVVRGSFPVTAARSRRGAHEEPEGAALATRPQ